MPWVDVGGTDVHYLEGGAGTPLVFLHGALSSAETWYRHLAALSDRYRVLAYDSVNHGLSSNSPRDVPEPDRADELQAFLDALSIDRPILAGQSTGGMTIIRWAIRHPAGARALLISGMGIPTEHAVAQARWSSRLARTCCSSAWPRRLPQSSTQRSQAWSSAT
jgi:pimeloyl-ACP methyl ester carboxylesterase